LVIIHNYVSYARTKELQIQRNYICPVLQPGGCRVFLPPLLYAVTERKFTQRQKYFLFTLQMTHKINPWQIMTDVFYT